MVQDNSLLDQAKHSEQISMQQMQLAELQKISSQLSSASVNSNTASSISNPYTGGVGSMPTNMTSVPNTPGGYNNGFDMTQAAAIGGLALKSGVTGINQAASVGKSALNRTAGYVERMQNSPFFAYNNIDWTRTNVEQAEYVQMQSRHRIENAGLKFGTALGNMGTASIGGAIGSAFGPIGTVAGTVAGSVVGSVGGDQVMKHVGVQQGYEKWLHQNSGRFINMFESRDSFGDGFDNKENKSMSKMLSKMNTDFFMSDDEMFTMLNNVTDAGLMKSTSNMKTFQKDFTNLVEMVKSGAKMLNMSYEEMINLQDEWNKMGIKVKDGEQLGMSSLTKTLSSITGKGEGESAQLLNMLTKNLVSGTTIDSMLGAESAQMDMSMASVFREKIAQGEVLSVIENDYGSDDAKVAASMANMAKQGYGNEVIKGATAAALIQGEDGKVSIDENRLSSILNDISSGKANLESVASDGGKNLINNFGRDFQHRYSQMDGNQMLQMMIETSGTEGAYGLINKLVGADASSNNLDMETRLQELGIAGSRNDAILYKEFSNSYDQYGDALKKDVGRQNAANIIRGEASSEFGVSLSQRIKAGWENGWQTMASWMPSLDGSFDKAKDFFTDTDSALRNGYSDAKKTSIADGEYKSVFENIANSSEKLDKEFKTNIKDSLNSGKKRDKFETGFDSITDVIFSPSRWDAVFSGADIVSTGLSHSEDSVNKLSKKVNKSKTMTQDEKDAMLSNISQAKGQTQDMVSGALDVVSALGGRDARELMLDSITIDSATKVRTGAKKFDDFTNEKVLNKLSLDDQQRIQDLAVSQATSIITKEFGGNLKGLEELVTSKGYDKTNDKINEIVKDGIKTSEIEGLVKEMMTASQGGAGETEMSKLLEDTTKDTASNTKKANKNLDKANKNMEEMSTKLDEFADTVNKMSKNLDQRLNTLESTYSRF